MSKRIEHLTKEQQERILPHRDYWLNYILSCKNHIDKERAKNGIEWLYKYCGREKPIIIFMDSPFGCQVAANFFLKYFKNSPNNICVNIESNIWNNIRNNISDNIWNNIRNNISDNISDNIWNNIRSNISDNISDNIRNNIRSNISDNISDNIRNNIWNNICVNISDNISDNIRNNIWNNISDNISDNIEYQPAGYYGNVGNYGWVAFMDYFLQLKMISTDREGDFNSFKEMLLSGIYEMIQFDGICFVSDLPVKIQRDDNNRLHDIDGMAVMFKDGFGQHYIHGRYIPEHLFYSIKDKSITTKQFFKENNEEVKSSCIAMMQELYVEEFVFRFFENSLNEIDTYVDKKEGKYLKCTTGGMNVGVYTLFKGEINQESVAYVRCFCPSTDRMFFLGVDPKYNNAKDAIASLYRVPQKLKGHIRYIQRQGERFSTVFDEFGTKMLRENMTQSDIQNTETISGDEYFSLLRFEY